MWVNHYSSEQDNPLRQPPFVQIRYVSYTDNLPAWSYGYHQHEDIYEVSFIVESSGALLLEHGRLALRTGDIVITPPRVLHSFSCGGEERMKYYSFWVDAEGERGPLQDFFAGLGPEPALVSACKYLSYIQSSLQILVELHQINGGQVDETYQSVCLGLFMLMKKLYQHRAMAACIDTSSYASDVLWYIDQHYSEDISLQSLARQFSISASHLRRVFKQVYGTSPITYLIQRRIAMAADFLLKTSLPVAEIARQVGYENTTHFSHLFTDRIGCTPGQFRARNQALPKLSGPGGERE